MKLQDYMGKEVMTPKGKAELRGHTSMDYFLAYYKDDRLNNCVLSKSDIKPILRRLESITTEECIQMYGFMYPGINENDETKIKYIKAVFHDHYPIINRNAAVAYIDWLEENDFDYRGLIDKGLAVEKQ